MAYWGNAAAECDYAFDAIGAYVFLIKERMNQDMETVLRKAHPEQGITASIACLRMLGERFPKCLAVSFRRKDFERARQGFNEWYAMAREKLPPERRDDILAEASREFELFEERILRH